MSMSMFTGIGLFALICGILCIFAALHHKLYYLAAATFFLIAYTEYGPDAIAKHARFEAEAEARNNTTPTVIKEFDGCKMYGMMVEGSRKYVTRCENTTKTEWEYRSGKRTIKEEIETVNQ